MTGGSPMTKRKPPRFKWDFAVEIQQSHSDVRVNDSIIAGMEGILPKWSYFTYLRSVKKTEARFTNHFLRKLLFWGTVDGCEMLGNGLYPFHQRSSKTSELRTNVQGQICHHGKNIVSKSSARVEAAQKSNTSEAFEFTGENTRARKDVFSGIVALGVAEVGSLYVSVSTVAGLDLAKLWTKSAKDCSESSFQKKKM